MANRRRLSSSKSSSSSYTYPECKGPYRHALYDYAPTRDEVPPRVLAAHHQMFFACERCGTRRFDGINAKGELVARDYKWPYDYHDGRDNRPTYAELRLIVIKRK